jgi:hypothetical protein
MARLVGDLPTILMQDKLTCFHEVCQLTLGHAPYQFVTPSYFAIKARTVTLGYNRPFLTLLVLLRGRSLTLVRRFLVA